MNACTLLARLDEIGATLARSGDHLVLRANATPVPREIVAAVRSQRAALLSLVASREIGGTPQAWTHALVALDPARPPGDVPAKRWEQFLNDGRRFLEHGWAVRAITLGWGPHDLFGCDRVKPYARVDRLGLVWFLDGRPIAALTAETARISTASGGHLTFRRRPIEPDLALAWTLPANDNRSVIGKKIDPGNLAAWPSIGSTRGNNQ